ncbi:hypothetical protein NDU88_000428 [Pleurodeles waltl]|uniref:Uncharacterized protein n=1 Tax=Pleurodeles waltl TaxID=8319 RepID=A0AAV7L6G4_PLEWA|nr:hypothetical protein NDU88_000428 [Pleurodeles waltl]
MAPELDQGPAERLFADLLAGIGGPERALLVGELWERCPSRELLRSFTRDVFGVCTQPPAGEKGPAPRGPPDRRLRARLVFVLFRLSSVQRPAERRRLREILRDVRKRSRGPVPAVVGVVVLPPEPPAASGALGTAEHPSAALGAAEHPSAALGAAEHPSAALGAAEHPSAALGAAQHPATILGAAEHPSAALGAAEHPSTILGAAELPATILGAAEHPSAALGAAEHPSAALGAAEHPSTILGAAEHLSAVPGTAEPPLGAAEPPLGAAELLLPSAPLGAPEPLLLALLSSVFLPGGPAPPPQESPLHTALYRPGDPRTALGVKSAACRALRAADTRTGEDHGGC